MCVLSPDILTSRAHEYWTLLTGLLAKHWYMPVCPTAMGEMVRLFPLIEIPPPPLSCAPLKYQVIVGVGIPATLQVKVTESPTNSSSLFWGNGVIIRGGAVWREGGVCVRNRLNRVWECEYEIKMTIYRYILCTLNSESGPNWGILLTSNKSTAHFKCHTSGCCR